MTRVFGLLPALVLLLALPAAPEALAFLGFSTHKVSGELKAYDADVGTVAVATAKGLRKFVIDSATRVWYGSRSVGPEHLAEDVGAKVTITYKSGQDKVDRALRVRVTPPKDNK